VDGINPSGKDMGVWVPNSKSQWLVAKDSISSSVYDNKFEFFRFIFFLHDTNR